MDSNLVKLKAIVEAFGIPVSALQMSGYSQSYCSRALSGDVKCLSPKFFRKLEENLSRLIDERRKQFFDLESVKAEKVDMAFKKSFQ